MPKYLTLPDDPLILATVTIPLRWCRLNMQGSDICHWALSCSQEICNAPPSLLTYSHIQIYPCLSILILELTQPFQGLRTLKSATYSNSSHFKRNWYQKGQMIPPPDLELANDKPIIQFSVFPVPSCFHWLILLSCFVLKE